MKPSDALQIDGPWRFLPDPHADGESLGFWKVGHSVALWREVSIPSCFEAGCPDIDFYEGLCWYQHSLRPLPTWRDQRIVLRFEAVNYRARVWLNGDFLGENRDGYLPFEFEIQDKLRRDGDHVLVLSVDNAHHAGDVPGMHVGWRGYGGITREVCLYRTDPLYIESMHTVALPCKQDGDVEFHVRIRNAGPDATQTTLDIRVQDTEGQVCAKLASAPITLAAGAADDVVVKGTLTGIHAWAPSSPVLYHAHAQLAADQQIKSEMHVPFGFRRIEATPRGLLLNGEPIFLTGFNRHEDSSRTAAAVDLETTRHDLQTMKEAGANFIRLCHYPHHPAELDMCDEIGLLVFAEIPLYFWNDAAEGQRTHAARAQTAARQLERMIARDFNHPSIVFWSVSNETPETEPDVVASNDNLIRLARALDPTRLCVHASCHWIHTPHFEEDDVMCVNHYPSINWGTRGHNPATFDLDGAADNWRANLDALHHKYPDKPILVTEFGYFSFAGTQGHSLGEDEHSKVIEKEFAAFDAPFICGATVWCWADHPWPAGRFLGGLSISPFGVVSRDRRKLKPFWTTRGLFRAKQGIAPPPNASRPGGSGIVMIRPTMDDIPAASFPEGYGIRPMTTDDIGLWTDIQRDAEPFIKITDHIFRDEFGGDLGALETRCFIITDPQELGVGTISAWYDRDFHGQEYGRIHWVAVRPSCQGKGLAKAALSYALHRLGQWHDRCNLLTSAERVPAIHLYLKFGFKPDLGSPHARELWAKLAAHLKHPALDLTLTEATESRED